MRDWRNGKTLRINSVKKKQFCESQPRVDDFHRSYEIFNVHTEKLDLSNSVVI